MMKKTILIFVAFMFCHTGCQRVEIEKIQNHTQLTASIEQFAGHTKTYLEDLNVFWEHDDCIAVFDNSTAKSCYRINRDAVGSTSGLFDSVSLPEEGTGDLMDGCIAYYPYSPLVSCEQSEKGFILSGLQMPGLQTFKENTIAQNHLPMAAQSDNLDNLSFRNICGIIKIQLLGEGTITSVTVSGNSDEVLSGEMQVQLDKGSEPIAIMSASGSKSVTLDCGESGVVLSETEPTVFMIVLPPTEFSNGLEVVITDSDGNSETIRTEKKNNLKRSKILSMPVVEYKSGTIFYVSDALKEEFQVSAFGGIVTLPVTTNAEIIVEIPENAKNWISVIDTKSAVEKNIILDIKGNTTGVYRKAIVSVNTEDVLCEHTITIEQIDQSECVVFKDEAVKAVCVEAFDKNGDSDLSYDEVEAVESLSNIKLPKTITSFDEFQYFNGVTDIPGAYFKNCTELESIILPETLKTIGNDAFNSCISLTEINLPESIDVIESGAFSSCHSLESVVIPGTLKDFSFAVFKDCTSLIDVTLPEGLALIPNASFNGCIALEKISIPSTVITIDNSAFRGCSSLTDVEIPGSVEQIDFLAFHNCTSLENIIIPDSVVSLGGSAFSGCKNLRNIELPDNLVSIGSSAFLGCESLTSISLPSSLATIEHKLFERCIALTDIEVPEGVTHIGDNAFCDCLNLKDVTLPSTLTSIGRYAFYGCESLNSIILPDSIVLLEDAAFQGVPLNSLTLPKNLEKIESSVFFNCTELRGELVLPESLTYIGSDAFYECDGLTGDLIIPESVTFLADGAFAWCKGFSSLTLGGGDISFGNGAFMCCEGLNSITFRENGVYDFVGPNTFDRCTSLTSVTIPEGITEIVGGMFNGCVNLKSVYLPDSLKGIGHMAFFGSSLEDIVCYAIVPPVLCDCSQSDCNSSFYDATIYVPQESLTAYKEAWVEYADCIVAIP